MILEITGTEDKIDGLLEVLRPFGLLEVVRTGQVAMRRGNKSATASAGAFSGAEPLGETAEVTAGDDVSYSV